MGRKKRPVFSDYRYRLGQNIARLRIKEIGCKQADMELLTGISRAYYGRIELGTHAATIDILVKIAKALNVPVYRLFIDDDNKPIL